MSPETSAISGLSVAEKLQLVEDLWDELAQVPSDIPVRDWQIDEMNRRRESLDSAPESALSWDDFMQHMQDIQRGE